MSICVSDAASETTSGLVPFTEYTGTTSKEIRLYPFLRVPADFQDLPRWLHCLAQLRVQKGPVMPPEPISTRTMCHMSRLSILIRPVIMATLQSSPNALPVIPALDNSYGAMLLGTFLGGM